MLCKVPKGPRRTKNTTRSKFTTRSIFSTAGWFTTGKSHPWTNTSAGGNFRRTFRTIGPYEFPQEKVWTNDWSIWISPEIRMDQWHSKFSESFSLDRYWSIECSSLCYRGTACADTIFLGITDIFPLQEGSRLHSVVNLGGVVTTVRRSNSLFLRSS